MKRADALFVGVTIGLLVFVALGVMSQQQRQSTDSVCMLNLTDIATAIRNYGTEIQLSSKQADSKSETMTPTMFLKELSRSESIRPRILVCPSDTRLPADDITNVTANNLSYFLSDKLGGTQHRRIIAGDRNIERDARNYPFSEGIVRWLAAPNLHTNSGWLVLADTSVVRTTNGHRLAEDITKANRTNRVIVP